MNDFLTIIILILVTSHSQCRQPSKTTLDCSNLKLTSIPNDIPNTFLALDMSFNELQHLEDDSFAKCCMNLLDLNLSHNLISNLNRKTFKNLIDVRRIYLRNNSISEFDPYTFADLLNLEKLDLSMNQLELQSSSTGFIVQPNLKELNLDDCKLSYIPEGGFVGVTQLENLTLSENPFEDDLDTSSFASLTSLIKLRMPNISRNSICELCSKLTEIDAINFDNFNLSCFYLLSSDSIDCNIENAVVGIDSTDPPMTLPILNAIPPKPTARESSTISISSTTAPTKVPLPANNSQEVIETNDHSGQSVTTSTEVNHAVVDIENETIRYILVGESQITFFFI